MPTLYRLSRRALRELRSICSYIAYDSPKAAMGVERAILGACELLARSPDIGSEREHVTALPVRFWTVSRFPNYQIVFRPETKPLQVVAILHGKRNLDLALRGRKRS